MKIDFRDIIRRPLITERASELQEVHNKFVFEVRVDANKLEIKKAAETMYNVRVVKVNTSSFSGKLKRMGAVFRAAGQTGKRRSSPLQTVTP